MPRNPDRVDEIIADAQEFVVRIRSLSIREGAALRRARSLDRCRKFRYWLKHGNDYAGPTDILRAIKNEQQILLNVRRYRETGIWSPELH